MWNHYMFNCTNVWNVVFRNEKPQFTQYGPFAYTENDNFMDPNY